MTTTETATARRRQQLADPMFQATALAAVAQLAGLAIALTGPAHAVAALAVAFAGAVIAAFVLAPRVGAALHRHPGLIVVGAVMLVGLLWVGLGLTGVGAAGLASLPGAARLVPLWRLGHAALLPLLLMSLAATGGLVLIADALRGRLGLASRRAPWQQLTAPRPAAPGVPWRALAGVLLVGWAAFLGIGVAGPYVAGSGLLQVVMLMSVAGGAAVVIGTPLLIASLTRSDRDRVGSARESERQRFAAHLHDSVLQTLALVQRQAHDPAAVAQLARRQEHALRAWMAGETELAGETLVSALRDVAAEVEEEEGITVELSTIGDRSLDRAGEALAAAAREALRNAARHAAGAGIVVFAEISAGEAAVFVRDDGDGFDPDAVPPERRGIRDAIIGRMAAVGGSATIESAPGEGTEVALRIGGGKPNGGGAR
jgi:signal transduction histidine kinase